MKFALLFPIIVLSCVSLASPSRAIGENIDELILAAEASFDNEYQDRIDYLPLP